MRHPIYSQVTSLEDFCGFMEFHVFAVWDFMSHLKALQNALTCTQLPWRPQGDALARRLINEIVLEEESDEISPGVYLSHFELYRKAMHEAGASSDKIDALLTKLQQGFDFYPVLETLNLAPAIIQFLKTNWNILQSQKIHAIASAFTLGREDLIPDMFRRLVQNLLIAKPGRLSSLQYYFERHIELDGERHQPMALQMLQVLCENDDKKWDEVFWAAQQALQARIQLWDGLSESLESSAKIFRAI